MHRLLALAPLLVACGPSEETYADVYVDVWCQVYDEQCDGGLIPDGCRPDTIPNEIDPEPPLASCTYDTFAAYTCLTIGGWSCETTSDGATVIPPEACERVWSCKQD